MLSGEDKSRINSVSTGIIIKYFGKESSLALFLSMENELTSAIEAILNTKVLVVCYEFALSPIVGVVRAEVHYKSSDSCISVFEIVCDQEQENEVK